MNKQTEWNPDRPMKEVSPGKSIEAPTFWIRDVVFLRQRERPADNVIRRIELRRGLNIIWAEPFKPESDDEEPAESFGGHAAGKTLLCRFLRYLLGEPHFGNEVIRERVVDTFPDGWVLGTVFVNNEPWLVGRPFGDKHGQFCVRNATVDNCLNGDSLNQEHFKIFEAAINECVITSFRIKQFPENAGAVAFKHILPWFARDQEARYSSPVVWRVRSSDSEASGTDTDERHFLIRIVLDLIHPEEKAEVDKNAKLLREQNELKNLIPLWQDRAKNDMETLKVELQHAKVEPEFWENLSLEDDILESSVQQRLNNELKRLESLKSEIPSDKEVDALKFARDRSIEKRINAKRDLDEVKEKEEKANKEWGNFQIQKSAKEMKNHQHQLELPPTVCGAPITLADQCGCNLWREWSNIKTDINSGAPAFESVDAKFKELIRGYRQNIQNKETALKTAHDEELLAERKYTDAEGKRRSLSSFLESKRYQFETLIRLASRSKATHEEAKKGEVRLNDLEKAIRHSYEDQHRIRKQQRDEINRFVTCFDTVCRHVLGRKIEGRISAAKRQLSFEVYDRGPLTSAAIETVKVLALDIAALWYSVEGSGFHPRFLIHDGPREADMNGWMYRRFFHFINKMENAFQDSEEPTFQYLITTTEPPPEKLCKEPWLREKLDAQSPEKRLLCTDFR